MLYKKEVPVRISGGALLKVFDGIETTGETADEKRGKSISAIVTGKA